MWTLPQRREPPLDHTRHITALPCRLALTRVAVQSSLAASARTGHERPWREAEAHRAWGK